MSGDEFMKVKLAEAVTELFTLASLQRRRLKFLLDSGAIPCSLPFTGGIELSLIVLLLV